MAVSDLKYQKLSQEVSEKNFSMLPSNNSGDILVKELLAFWPCLKSLPDAKVMSFGLIPLKEEISDNLVYFQYPGG